jgi:Family of unknown function (DUF6166)
MNEISQIKPLAYSSTSARRYSGEKDSVTISENGDTRRLRARPDLDPIGRSDFAWGSISPAGKRLALALLSDALEDDQRACDLADIFSTRVIAILPERWTMTRERVLSYIDLITRQKLNEFFATTSRTK